MAQRLPCPTRTRVSGLLLCWMGLALELPKCQLDQQLMDNEFREAAGVLEMISKTPEDRQYYEARLKFLHDAEARLIAAREEGREEGREKGREEGREEGALAGKIQLLQELLGEEPTDLQELLLRSRQELEALSLALQQRARERR